ncbi:MAG: hypothetical protein R6V20_04615 [Desulfobia sp.]
MHTNTALYFPDTSIDIKKVFEELLLFGHIYFYQAAENSAPTTEKRWNDLCSGYPPLPFGSELDRFNQLIEEIKGHVQEFYSGQLTGMALNSLESRSEKTVREIIAAVSGRDGQNGKTGSQDTLWHSRLLLKLAEIKRREEEELTKKLAGISKKEVSLYKALKGHPGIDSLITGHPAESAPLPAMTDTILKAWGYLFINDREQRHNILLTADKNAAESLFETHNTLSSGRLPVRICRLSLPLTEDLGEEARLNFRREFREKAKKVIAGFSDLFSKIILSGQKQDTIQKSTTLAAEWGSLIEDFNPRDGDLSATTGKQSTNNLPHLEIYLCEHSPALLVARHCRLSPLSAYAGNNYGLLALKTSKPVTCMD